MIMTEWKTYKLSEIGTVVGGATPSTTVEKFYGGDIPWLTPKDLSNFQDRYIERGERNITQEGLDSCSAHLLPANTVLFSSRAPIGYVAIAKNPIATNQGFKSVIPNDNVDSLFLYYTLKHNKEKIEAMGSGTTFKEVSGAVMKNVEISLPSLEEQRRIAGILGAIDDKIENNRRINANLESQAQALYKQWFVDNRNKDWETLTLDDVATISAGGDKPQVCSEQKTQECNIPIYSNSIDREGLYGYTNNPRIIENSITISARGTIGYVCLRTEPYVPIVRLISVIPTHDNMSAYFLYLWALTQNISGTGTTQQQLTVPAFRTTQIVVPSQEILIRFNKVVKPIFDCIKQNKVENETLTTLRDTLLPKLMNGEIKM